MRRYLYWVSLALGVLLATPAAWADSLTFTVLPTDVSGPAGTTVGWGFSITNNSTTDYLDISGIDSDLFAAADGTPDASIFLFPNLAPGQTMTQVYDPVDDLGLFQFTWNTGLTTGTTETGVFTLNGAFCPLVDQFCVEDGSVTSTALATGAYSATVSPSGGVITPEPSAALLLGTGLFVLGWIARRRQDVSA
ncbi:MAG TPA: PEP-CTERM sorting domain-containing protein [Candidatus Acidoferrales bacterium]|nr:PEP-CTERM sorting domain-containing protein [Candidatus Acidoferrales bacterium]